MAEEERSDSIQSVELPSDMLNLVMLTNGNSQAQPAQMDLSTIDGIPGFTPHTLNDLHNPKLNIIEQPKSVGFIRMSAKLRVYLTLPSPNIPSNYKL